MSFSKIGRSETGADVTQMEEHGRPGGQGLATFVPVGPGQGAQAFFLFWQWGQVPPPKIFRKKLSDYKEKHLMLQWVLALWTSPTSKGAFSAGHTVVPESLHTP